MALIKCRNCGEMVLDCASVCVYCHKPTKYRLNTDEDKKKKEGFLDKPIVWFLY